ncbi:MAG: cation:proton antiporter [Spirochaetes bacterium]|nr:cation:proton antiporter [Spirochaetota bacterium]
MGSFGILSDRSILSFLVQLLVILGTTRIVGSFFKRVSGSRLPAEILVGIALGPTLLGRFWPAAFEALFPRDIERRLPLEITGWIGILLFLLTVGLEINALSAWRMRRQVARLSAVSLAIPLAGGAALALFIPPEAFGPAHDGVLTTMIAAGFLAVAAMPAAMRALSESGILASDLGAMTGTALSINELAGWVFFTTAISSVVRGRIDSILLAREAILVPTLIAAGMLLGRKGLRPLALRLRGGNDEETGAAVSIVVLTGILCGVLTTLIGVHAFFGFFLAGLVVDMSGTASASVRSTIGRTMDAVFVPVFFVTIGIKVDVFGSFDWRIVVLVTLVGPALRFLGAWIAAAVSGVPRSNRALFAACNTPSGELHVIIAAVACEAGALGEPFLAAVLVSVLVNTTILGPWVRFLLDRRGERSIIDLLPPIGTDAAVSASDRDDAIRELSDRAAALAGIDGGTIRAAVLEREASMGTAFGDRVAFPHARIPGLRKPVIVPGYSISGIRGWNSPDGRDVRLVFLILTPEDDQDLQLRILRGIAVPLHRPGAIPRLASARNEESFQLELRSLLGDQHLELKGRPADAHGNR